MVARFALTTILLATLVTAPHAADAVSAKSGLHGVVRKGPVKPVCSIDEPCDAPARVTLLFSRGGHTMRVRSSYDGRYRIALAPGIYDVRSLERIGIHALPRPHAVHVRPGHWDHIDFFFDTGIR